MSDPTLKQFEFRDGTVTGDTSQEDAKNFAADFQGLRHFGSKIGQALDLGNVWLGAYREADFTHLWTCSVDGQSGSGGMIASHAPLFELFQHVSTEA